MSPSTENPEFLAIAQAEIKNKTYNENLWRKAMALMGGDEEKARKKYIKLRILDFEKNGYKKTSQNEHKEKGSTSDTSPHGRNTKKSKQKVKPKSKPSPKDDSNDKAKSNNSWVWWFLIAGIVVWLIVQSNNDSKSSKNISNTSYSKSSDYSSDYASPKKDNYYEKKPSSSTNTLDKNEVLYCEAEMIRLDIVKDKIDQYSQYEIDKYNNLSDDYNSRCANKQYYKNDMYIVNRLIKERRSKIEEEGLARFQKTKSKKVNNTFNYNNSSNTKTSNTGSKIGNCKVTIFNDGSIGAEINGKFIQWKNVSSWERDQCKRALKREQNRVGSKGNIHEIKTSSTGSKIGSCKVTIFNDGSIGAKIDGKFKQWKYMSTGEKGQCEKALRQEQSKNKRKSNTKTKTYTEKKGTQKYSLTIKPTPSNVRVQIMNIKPKYYAGMKLKKGKYDIKVSKKGYKTIRTWINLEKDEFFTVTLEKRKSVPDYKSSSKKSTNNGLPAHAKLNYLGNGWECKRGYYKRSNGCQKVGIPAHAKLNYLGNGWECKRGYSKRSNGCQKVGIPAHAKLNYLGNGWECKRGYSKRSNGCQKVGIPAHAKLNYLGNGWECKRGYYKRSNGCILVGK